jgi:hypothetical protein
MATPTISSTRNPKPSQPRQSPTSSKTEQRTSRAAAINLEQPQSTASLNSRRISSPSSSSNATRRTQDCAITITPQSKDPLSSIELSDFYTKSKSNCSANIAISDGPQAIMHNRLKVCHLISEDLRKAFPSKNHINLRNIDQFQIDLIKDLLTRMKRILGECKNRYLPLWIENREVMFQTIENDIYLTMDYSNATSLLDALYKFSINAENYLKNILDHNRPHINPKREDNLGRRALPFTPPEIPSSPSSIKIEPVAALSPQLPDDSDLEKKVPDDVDNTKLVPNQALALYNPVQLTDEQKNKIRLEINKKFRTISKESKLFYHFPRKKEDTIFGIRSIDDEESLGYFDAFFSTLNPPPKKQSFHDFCRFQIKYKNYTINTINDTLELLNLYPSRNPNQEKSLTDYLEIFTSYTAHYISLAKNIEIPILGIINNYCTTASGPPIVLTENPNPINTHNHLKDSLNSAAEVLQAFPVNLVSKKRAFFIPIQQNTNILFQLFNKYKSIADINDLEIATVNRYLNKLEKILKKIKDEDFPKWAKNPRQKVYSVSDGLYLTMNYNQAQKLFEILQEFHKQATSYWKSILVVRSPDPLITNGIDLEKIN